MQNNLRNAVQVPLYEEENRESGANPERTRHCNQLAVLKVPLKAPWLLGKAWSSDEL
jgi:hypothetical protein